MERWLRVMVVGGAAVFIGVSATMNATFLASLGRTPREAMLFGLVSVAADVVKAALPVILVRSVMLRAWGHAVAAGVLLAIVVVMSLASGVGYAAMTRGSVTMARQGSAEALMEAGKDLKRIEAELDAVATARSIAVVEAELTGLEMDRRWQTSLGCADLTNPVLRQYCADVQKLRVERAQATDAARLRGERDKLRQKLSALRERGAGEDSDPQAAALAALLGVSKDWPRTGLTIGLAVLLELGSVVLVILAVGPALRIQPDREMPCDVEACHEGTPATVPLQTDRSYWRRQRSKSIVAPDTAVIGRGPHHGT